MSSARDFGSISCSARGGSGSTEPSNITVPPGGMVCLDNVRGMTLRVMRGRRGFAARYRANAAWPVLLVR